MNSAPSHCALCGTVDNLQPDMPMHLYAHCPLFTGRELLLVDHYRGCMAIFKDYDWMNVTLQDLANFIETALGLPHRHVTLIAGHMNASIVPMDNMSARLAELGVIPGTTVHVALTDAFNSFLASCRAPPGSAGASVALQYARDRRRLAETKQYLDRFLASAEASADQHPLPTGAEYSQEDDDESLPPSEAGKMASGVLPPPELLAKMNRIHSRWASQTMSTASLPVLNDTHRVPVDLAPETLAMLAAMPASHRLERRATPGTDAEMPVGATTTAPPIVVKVDVPAAVRTVHLKGIPVAANRRELRDWLDSCGEVLRVRVRNVPRPYECTYTFAHVEYALVASATALIAARPCKPTPSGAPKRRTVPLDSVMASKAKTPITSFDVHDARPINITVLDDTENFESHFPVGRAVIAWPCRFAAPHPRFQLPHTAQAAAAHSYAGADAPCTTDAPFVVTGQLAEGTPAAAADRNPSSPCAITETRAPATPTAAHMPPEWRRAPMETPQTVADRSTRFERTPATVPRSAAASASSFGQTSPQANPHGSARESVEKAAAIAAYDLSKDTTLRELQKLAAAAVEAKPSSWPGIAAADEHLRNVARFAALLYATNSTDPGFELAETAARKATRFLTDSYTHVTAHEHLAAMATAALEMTCHRIALYAHHRMHVDAVALAYECFAEPSANAVGTNTLAGLMSARGLEQCPTANELNHLLAILVLIEDFDDIIAKTFYSKLLRRVEASQRRGSDVRTPFELAQVGKGKSLRQALLPGVNDFVVAYLWSCCRVAVFTHDKGNPTEQRKVQPSSVGAEAAVEPVRRRFSKAHRKM